MGGDRPRLQAGDEFGVSDPEGRALLPHLSALRQRIHAEVCDRGFNPKVGAFTQSYRCDHLDRSVLVIPHYGFLPAHDPRMVGTVAAIEKGLLREGFVLGYATESDADGLPASEGAFLACSFWLAENRPRSSAASVPREPDGGGGVEKKEGDHLQNPPGSMREEVAERRQRA